MAENLVELGFSAVSLNGDMEQRQQQLKLLFRFANQSANVLVATDVAARGFGHQRCGFGRQL